MPAGTLIAMLVVGAAKVWLVTEAPVIVVPNTWVNLSYLLGIPYHHLPKVYW